MNTIAGFNSEQIRDAVKEIKKIKPDFSPMFDIYEKIFVEQEELINKIKIPEYKIPDDVLSLKQKENFPLVNINQITIDKENSVYLFNKICSILTESSDEFSASMKKIKELIDKKKIDINEAFSAYLNENESFFDNFEKEHEIDKSIFGFIIYNSLKPSIHVFSKQLSIHLDSGSEWNKGYCPVCGSAPEISVFEENGKRFMICGFCSHKWATPRMYCPFCENSDHETLQYFEIEKEEEYRVDVCEKCKKYIKTIDIKKTSRTIYLPLENQSTPYIDLRFREMGYKPGSIKS